MSQAITFSVGNLFLYFLCFMWAFLPSRNNFTLLGFKFVLFCRFFTFSYAAGPFGYFNSSNFFSFVERLPVLLLVLSFVFLWGIKSKSLLTEDSSVNNWLVSLCLIFFGAKVFFFFFCLVPLWVFFRIAILALLLITKSSFMFKASRILK